MGIFRPELHHSIGSRTGLGILQPHRLQRTELHGLAAPFGHHLDGNAAFKIGVFSNSFGWTFSAASNAS